MLRHPKYVYGSEDCFIPAKLNLGDFLIKKYKTHGDKTAFINAVNDERLTYNDMVQAAVNVAVSLVRIGVKKGDVVAICSETRLENWSTFIGAACTGAVVTPISIAYIKDELKHIIDISKPKYLFCSKTAMVMHEDVFKSLDYIKKIIYFDEDTSSDLLCYKDLAKASPNSIIENNVNVEQFRAVDVKESDTACIMYSSGTTGMPKGVMLTHLNMIISCSMSNLCDPEKVVLNIAPWFHVMGLMLILIYMIQGPPIVFLSKFELNLYLRSIEKYKAGHLLLVPPVLQMINKTSFEYDLSSVETMLCGATVLKTETIEASKTKFKNLRDVYQGYGMTEATIIVAIATHFNDPKYKTGSVGKVAENTVLKIVDVETREPLGPHQRGEVCFKSPTLMKGYIGDENKSSDLYDEEGFLKSGDIGYYDDEKYLYIVDRMKELIKYKGYQVPPAEIETVLMQHPGVRDVGVVGLTHATAGEVPLAFVVPQPNVTLTESELKQFVAERLSNPKYLRGGVRFIKEIPKNPTGKIRRKYLRNMLLNNQEL